jgi:hypothetical protein
MKNLALVLCAIILMVPYAKASLITYGVCQSGCAGLAVACYARALYMFGTVTTTAGYVFGTVTAGVGTAPAILSCNNTFGKCSSTCSSIT